MQTQVKIELPDYFPQAEKIELLSAFNPHLRFQFDEKTGFCVKGKKQNLNEKDFFTLKLPFQYTDYKVFIKDFIELNPDLKPEFILPDKIIINMLTPEMIAAFTMAIGAVLFMWNRSQKKGRVYDGTARYDIDVSKGEIIEKQHRAPDFSYIDFEKIAKEKLNKATYIAGSPTFCGEILSQKHQLRANLKKMREVWMASGTELGVVVCPYRRKYYVFDHNLHYKIHDFSETFRHDLLAGLELNFGELLDEIS